MDVVGALMVVVSPTRRLLRTHMRECRRELLLMLLLRGENRLVPLLLLEHELLLLHLLELHLLLLLSLDHREVP